MNFVVLRKARVDAIVALKRKKGRKKEKKAVIASWFRNRWMDTK